MERKFRLDVDNDLSDAFFTALRNNLDSQPNVCIRQCPTPVSCSLLWGLPDMPVMAVVLPADWICPLLACNTLSSYLDTIAAAVEGPRKQRYLVTIGLRERLKTKWFDGDLSVQWRDALEVLTMLPFVSPSGASWNVVQKRSEEEAAIWATSLTLYLERSLTKPFTHFAGGLGKRIKKKGLGQRGIYIAMLEEVTHVSARRAEAIASLYPTMASLLDAFRSAPTQHEKEDMLRDVTVDGMRLGSALSKNIYDALCHQ